MGGRQLQHLSWVEGRACVLYSSPELFPVKRRAAVPVGVGTVTEASGEPAKFCTLTRNTTMAFRKFLPLFDRVLVERFAAETVSKGGIMLPEKSQGKVLQATVLAVGPGNRTKAGDLQPVSVKAGDRVLLPEYGGTKVTLDDKEYFLFRDGDILGKYLD
ncbi:10 kDa heat shock protein, mitochondrial-like isoform X2 [Polyodon spathula]|uniref:10 kDa heat shock protein, mitochondrial-like isoform X2 n=1 Tax=Polyodon spathula TaxID=7913 RepID=UPI001B7EB9E9|nr:10 kDa heat shock protein, mitochondrial-like isoform X2 [Polyodon spathula]